MARTRLAKQLDPYHPQDWLCEQQVVEQLNQNGYQVSGVNVAFCRKHQLELSSSGGYVRKSSLDYLIKRWKSENEE